MTFTLLTTFWLSIAPPAAPPPAAVPPAAEALERARVCRAALDLECVETELGSVQNDLADATPALAIAIRRLYAEAELSLERPAADAALEALLRSEPTFSGDDWPPAWRGRLDRVRRTLPDMAGPTADATLPASQGGEPAPFEVVATDPSGIALVRVTVRDAVQGTQQTFLLATQDGRTYPGTVPAELVLEPCVMLWVEVVDHVGNVTRLGSPDRPLSLPVGAAAESDIPVYKTWWFWTATVGGAALLAGAGVLTWALLDSGESGAPAAREYGDVNVEVSWPTHP